jgi:predicted DCC family thiol-disulfide oxidoreductase YuxK
VTNTPSPMQDHLGQWLAGQAPIAVMDADCALCSWGARMINWLDASGSVRICPVQSPLGAALMARHGVTVIDPESWLFIDAGVAHRDFDAVIHAGRQFGGWGRLTSVLALLPKPLRDWLYRRVARNRYRLFGRADLCAIPDQGLQKRLLTALPFPIG